MFVPGIIFLNPMCPDSMQAVYAVGFCSEECRESTIDDPPNWFGHLPGMREQLEVDILNKPECAGCGKCLEIAQE